MAVTAFDADTQTAVISTEHFVADVDEAGVFSFHVDTGNMVAGDIVELRTYQMILTSTTAILVNIMTYMGVQDIPIKISEPISNDLAESQALRFSLKQTFGTGRNFPWKVLKHA
jgi:hypothetical protein